MPRAPGVQITRSRRRDGSTTFALRARAGGQDERIPLGNTTDGWDELRAEAARKQLLAKIELGLWSPASHRAGTADEEPTFRELATDWLEDRRRNPATRPKTIELYESQITRYLLPFFGDLLPSQITTQTIKAYRRGIHDDNARIRAAAEAGHPLVDPRTHQRIRTLGNESINKTIRVLAQILDEAEDAEWLDRNPARSRRVREPLERRRRGGALDPDEFLSLLDAASHLDEVRHSARTLHRAEIVRGLRDNVGHDWKTIGQRLGIAPTTAIYLYSCRAPEAGAVVVGPRRAIIATMGLAGPRVSEICQLDNRDCDLGKGRLYIRDSKTEAGVRDVDIGERLRSELQRYIAGRGPGDMEAPLFPSRAGRHRNKDTVRLNIVGRVVEVANRTRLESGQPPIRAHVTPHTFRRTYITYMLAAGYEIPYVQAQVGHTDPTTTLAIYAQLIRRADRDKLRAELRALMDTPLPDPATAAPAQSVITPPLPRIEAPAEPHIQSLGSAEKAGKGRTTSR